MQQIFAKIGVEPLAKEGLYGDTKKLDVSGDGTCINTGASNFGNKVCDCIKNGIYNCDCARKFSDPYARWGWDSYHGQWFYGYTEYILSVYNKDLKSDLPLYLRMVQAQRFDGISAVIALAEAKKLYPEFNFDSFIGDGAHDNYATYQLLHERDMKAFIPLNETNKGNFQYPPHLNIDNNGIPHCMAGHAMVNWGFNRDRCRIKYRCPLALGKVDSCKCKEQCSPSPYGRCTYIKPFWDLRFLNDYGLEQSHTRGKKCTFWWSVIHSLNVLLDARLKKSKFSFIDLLSEKLTQAA